MLNFLDISCFSLVSSFDFDFINQILRYNILFTFFCFSLTITLISSLIHFSKAKITKEALDIGSKIIGSIAAGYAIKDALQKQKSGGSSGGSSDNNDKDKNNDNNKNNDKKSTSK